ncbi:asparagine synthase-related protein [Streptomyces albus]|uniref:asparagine synthase-related protein n=1 Tax=Streptomyces albus TaxID=1888 RepID=UPI0024AE6957|nr:asparagine synthase-related protein [Streptomyces albus]MDI6413009.1 asparagine synthase-related protein [Streptomyces albus]
MDFLIFPDHPTAQHLVSTTPALAAASVVPHASGRPWLVGWWDELRVQRLTAGPRRLAVVGHTRRGPGRLHRAFDRARSLEELDAAARSLAGSCHLLASFDGKVRAQGSLSTARQIFTVRVRGLTVAGSAPGLLAALAEAPCDETALAARLLTPYVPWPLSRRTVWRGVEGVAPGHWLELSRDGSARERRWWRRPEPVVPLSQAAERVRAALREAVLVRAESAGAISADLSGGLDSTSLCFVADELGVPTHTYHAVPLDPRNPDHGWARRAAAQFGPAVHHTDLPQDHAMRLFPVATGGSEEPDGGEGPFNWRWAGPHLRALSRTAAEAGSRLHLMGLGGDELFGPLPNGLWAMLRAEPRAALGQIRRRRLLNRWPLVATVRGLADRSRFPSALRSVAGRLTSPPPQRWEAGFGWTGEARLPAWSTPRAVALVRRALWEEAEAGAEPLDGDRFGHQVLEYLAFEGTTMRQTSRAMAPFGVGWEAPFLDDRVIEAALSARLSQRMPTGSFKPLLVAAMRGIVPDDVLDRTDKGEFSAELYEGLARGREAAVEMCAALRLGARGLADADALRNALLSPPDEGRYAAHLETTVAVEAWLRSPHTRPALPGTPPSGPRDIEAGPGEAGRRPPAGPGPAASERATGPDRATDARRSPRTEQQTGSEEPGSEGSDHRAGSGRRQVSDPPPAAARPLVTDPPSPDRSRAAVRSQIAGSAPGAARPSVPEPSPAAARPPTPRRPEVLDNHGAPVHSAAPTKEAP